MRKIQITLAVILSFTLASCDNEIIDIVDTPEDNAAKYDIVGSLEMTSGPHDMAVKDNFLFTCINDKINIIDISIISTPTELAIFDDLEAEEDKIKGQED